MDNVQFLGLLVIGLTSLGGLVAIIMKIIQPVNDLRVVIQKLNDRLDSLMNDNVDHNRKIEKHDEQIHNLDHRVGKIETKIEMYHEEGPSQ